MYRIWGENVMQMQMFDRTGNDNKIEGIED